MIFYSPEIRFEVDIYKSNVRNFVNPLGVSLIGGLLSAALIPIYIRAVQELRESKVIVCTNTVTKTGKDI